METVYCSCVLDCCSSFHFLYVFFFKKKLWKDDPWPWHFPWITSKSFKLWITHFSVLHNMLMSSWMLLFSWKITFAAHKYGFPWSIIEYVTLLLGCSVPIYQSYQVTKFILFVKCWEFFFKAIEIKFPVWPKYEEKCSPIFICLFSFMPFYIFIVIYSYWCLIQPVWNKDIVELSWVVF